MDNWGGGGRGGGGAKGMLPPSNIIGGADPPCPPYSYANVLYLQAEVLLILHTCTCTRAAVYIRSKEGIIFISKVISFSFSRLEK